MFHFIKKALVVGFMTALAFMLATSSASAQVGENEVAFPHPDVVDERPVGVTSETILTDISVYESSVVFQKGNLLRISFDIQNNGSAVSDIGYALDILKDGTSVDKEVYSENLALGEGQLISREVDYVIPASFDGVYEVWVIAQNSAGVPVGIGTIGDVSFKKTNNSLDIILSTCFLQVEGEKSAQKYDPLLDVVDITKDETLIAVCDVVNNFDTTVTADVSFETRNQSPFGELVGTESVENDSITIARGATKTIRATLPKVSTPQQYSTKLTLVDGDGVALSNSASFGFVLQGVSASIQSLSIDKTSYASGETATVDLTWSSSVDTSSDSRGGEKLPPEVFLELAISQKDRGACASTLRTNLSLDSELTQAFDILIPNSCSDVEVQAVILDAENNVLAQKFISTVVLAEEESVSTSALFAGNIQKTGIVVLVVVATLLLILFIRKRKTTMPLKSLLFALVFAGALLAPAGEAEAVTFGYYFYGSPLVTYTTNTNKSAYLPGENIVVTGSIWDSKPGHSAKRWSLDAALGTETKNIATRNQHQNANPNPAHNGNWYGSVNFTAPTIPGVYSINLSGALRFPATSESILYSGTASIFFTVIAPKIPPTLSFSVQESNIQPNTSTTLNWVTTGATSCFASGAWGPGGKPWRIGSESTGNLLPGVYTYNLSCTGRWGTVTDSVTVNVATNPPVINTFSANPSPVDYNGSTFLSWSVTDADYCLPSGFSSAVTLPVGVTSIPNLITQTTYGLTCYGPLEQISGGSGGGIFIRQQTSASVTVPVNQALPVITLSATPPSINYDDSTTLDWSVAGNATCTASNGAGAWPGIKPLSGSEVSSFLTANTTFTLECTNTSGTDSESVVVTVDAAPNISITPSGQNFGSVENGSSDTRTFTISNTGGSVLSGTVSVSAPYSCISGCTYGVSGLPATATIQFSPTSSGTFNRTVTFASNDPDGNATATVSGTGVPPGPTLSLSAASSPIPYDTSTTLNWSGTNITSCTATGGTAGWAGSKGTSGSEATGNITSDTTFTLQCSGAGGSVTDSVTVTNIAAVCGNGICEAPGENISSCIADCSFNPSEF